MKVSTFIERPVLSAVISITIMVAGIIGLFTLPVEQYPDIAPPTVMVSTTYFGANAETMQKSVVAPLEEAINGVEDMTYMTSTATNSGTATITIYFQQGAVFQHVAPVHAGVDERRADSRSGHGRRKRTEPCIESDRAIAGRGYPSGCHDFQAPDQYVTDLLAL